jgi:hypothetical protein
MVMHWPQIAMIVLASMTVAQALFQHGKMKTDRHNFYLSAVAIAFELWILVEGGFFSQP